MVTETRHNGRDAATATEATATPEAAVLSGIFARAEILDELPALKMEHFRDQRNAFLFSTCRRLWADGIRPHLLSVADHVDRFGDLSEHLGADWHGYLTQLCDYCVTSDVPHYAAKLVEAGERRRLRLEMERIQQRLADPAADLSSILRSFERLADIDIAQTDMTAMTGPELDAGDFPQEYLVSGLLVKGQPCIVAAPKKSLKTNSMIDMTLSLASGSRFLNEFHVPHCVRTALISGESGAATIQETARRVAKSKPWRGLEHYPDALFGFDLPNFGDDRSMLALRRFIKRNSVEVLIVDPAYLCLPIGDDAGNLFKVGQVLMPFSRMAGDLGITPIIVHHFTKAAAISDGPPEMEAIAWAGFQEWARQWLLFSRRSKYDPDRPGHHELWLSAGGSAGHSVAKAVDIEEGHRDDAGGRIWEVSVSSVGQAVSEQMDAVENARDERAKVKAEQQLQKDIAAVIQTLRENPDGIAPSKLRDDSGVRGPRMPGVLRELRASKTIEDCFFIGANRREYEGIRLATGQPDATGRNRTESERPVEDSRTDALSPI